MLSLFRRSPFVRASIRRILDLLLQARGIRLPNDFHLRQRFQLLFRPAEPDIERAASKLLAKGMHVIDIGANIGIVTRTFASLVGPAGRIIAFEPDPTNYEFLKWNTQGLPNVESLEAGVSDASGEAELFLNPISGTGNALHREGEGWQSVKVKCWSLDDFLKKRALSRLDLVKIDVEGAEISVLRGMAETIKRFSHLKLIIEYCPDNLKRSGHNSSTFFAELERQQIQFSPISAAGDVLPAETAAKIDGYLNHAGYVNLLCYVS